MEKKKVLKWRMVKTKRRYEIKVRIEKQTMALGKGEDLTMLNLRK